MLQKLKGGALNKSVSDFLLENGAVSVGFSTRETLADSPPSADITYLMENGLSAVSFALPLNKEHIRPYLAKEDRLSHHRDYQVDTTGKVRQLSFDIAAMLEKEGHRAIGTETNIVYRTEVPNWGIFLPPDISHRYLAVASGVGSFGWSGNVGTKGYGTTIMLGSTITDAELEATFPIPEEESFCSDCKACVGACPYEMFSATEKMSVTLGGREYTYAARIDLARCQVCCIGASGLHKSGKWSSWSPGRYEAPEGKDDFRAMHDRAVAAMHKRPPLEEEIPRVFDVGNWGGKQYTNTVMLSQTCTTCSLVCTGDKQENLENLKILRSSGCVIQYPDGSLVALPPDEAEAEFQRMAPEHRALYC